MAAKYDAMVETRNKVNSQSSTSTLDETGTRLVQDMFKSSLGSEPVVEKNWNCDLFMVDQEMKKKALWVLYSF